MQHFSSYHSGEMQTPTVHLLNKEEEKTKSSNIETKENFKCAGCH